MNPRTHKILRISTIALASVLGAAVLVVGAVLVRGYNETRDPPGPRTCDCDLLQQWATTLPLTPQDDRLEANEVRVEEGANGFFIGGSGLDDVDVDRQAILDALTAHGFQYKEGVDQPDEWVALFYPGANAREGPWSLEVRAIGKGIGIKIGVTVDGSPWGLETGDDLRDSYQDDHEAALTAQEERQRQAIETLQPLEQALQSMVDTTQTTNQTGP
jgi:hypothetical protein